MTEISVETKNLSRAFGKFIAVDNITFDVKRGEIFGFLGANGAGKTTTIRMLCGLLLPTSGEGWVSGYNVLTESEKIKQTIGYMSQKFSLYEDLTVRENIMFFGGIYGLKNEKLNAAYSKVINSLGLVSLSDRLTKDIPLGWKQRLALSCAILHKPSIIFLDEPTGGVDPISRREFWELIYNLADQGTTVFVTTHYMEEAEYCNRLSIMHKGKIIALDTPEALKKQYDKETIQGVFVALVKE